MLTQADRTAERRRVKLEKLQRQAKEGSLKIRKMTPEAALALSRLAGQGTA